MEISSIYLLVWIVEIQTLGFLHFYLFIIVLLGLVLVTFGVSSLFLVWCHVKKCALL